MKQKLEHLRKKLLAVARAQSPADSVPYAFEKRVMALALSATMIDAGALWARALWRGAVSSLVVVCIVAGVSVFVPRHNGNTRTATDEFSSDFEQTMLAVVDRSGEPW